MPELVTAIPFRWRIIIAKGGASGNEADAPEGQATDKKLESCFHAACELSCYLGLTLGLSWRPVQNCYGADPWGWKGRQRKGWAGVLGQDGPSAAAVRAAPAIGGGVGVPDACKLAGKESALTEFMWERSLRTAFSRAAERTMCVVGFSRKQGEASGAQVPHWHCAGLSKKLARHAEAGAAGWA